MIHSNDALNQKLLLKQPLSVMNAGLIFKKTQKLPHKYKGETTEHTHRGTVRGVQFPHPAPLTIQVSILGFVGV